MKHKKLIELMLTSIIMLLVVLPNSLGSVKAVDDGKGVHYDGVRIDGQYPLGVSSDYLLVAGNRIRHLGDAGMTGRFMANSMNFQKTNFWNPAINSHLNQSQESAELWNPAVVVNDFTAENQIEDSAMANNQISNPVARLIYEISNMWPYDPSLGKPVNEDAVKFITDSSKEDVKKSLDGNNQTTTEKYLDYIYNYKFDTKADGTPHTLSDLTQFSDNDVTKYEYENSKSGKSVQNDIANVSEYYESLTPDTELENGFWTSDNSVVNDLGNNNSGNPTYKIDGWSAVTDVIINITNKTDANPNQIDKTKPDAQEGKKTVVAASIDLDKIHKINPKSTGIKIVLNYSEYYYKENGLLDTDKIPYLVLNYKGFDKPNTQFKWAEADSFAIESASGSYQDLWQALGASGNTDWSNENVLDFGSRTLNNFTDVQDVDNNPESYNKEKQNLSGITGDTAAVSFTNLSQMWFGSIIIAHGSFYAGSPSQGLYIGGIIAANNISLDNAKISPGHGDGIFSYNHGQNGKDFPTLSVNSPTIDSVTLQDTKDENKQTVEDEGILTFSYDKNDLKPAPDLGLSGTLNLSDVPNDYGLYYRLNNSGDWQRFSDSTVSGNTVKLDEQFITTLNNSVKLNSGTVENSQSQIVYPMKRTSQLQFATTADATESTLTVEAMKTKATATFSFGLEVSGSLKLMVPEKLLFGTEILGQSTGEVTKALDVNEIQSVKANVADQGTVENPKIIVNNPMLSNYHLQLAYLGIQSDKQDNPFYLKDNFKFKLDNTTIALTSDTGWSSDISSRQNESLVKQLTESPLQSKKISFILPYNNQYKVGEYQVSLSWQLTI